MKCGSSAWMRLTSGGCVAYIDASSEVNLKPSPNSMWLTFSDLAFCSFEPASNPPIFFSAPASPLVWRVNWTADASARNSRCREMAALMRRPKNTPTQPIARSANPRTAALLRRLPLIITLPITDSAVIPASTPMSLMLNRISPLTMWLNSCAITPISSSRLSRSSAPWVTHTAASAGVYPAANALIPGSLGR